LLTAVLSADAAPERLLKQSRLNRTFRASLFGRDVVIKRFDLPTLRHRVKYWMRSSRARRAWAAGQTLTAVGIPTPPPLGFIECSTRGWPAASYALTGFFPEAIPARRWVKARLHRQSPAFRDAFGHDLRSILLALYRRRIYHADTKTNNLLVLAPDAPERRRFSWIDLECVQFGIPPTRRRVLRNLVQLNGSVGSKLAEADRMAFLHGLAGEFPWVADEHIAQAIRRRTLERLDREVRGRCGP
jgi:hypothetical protein